MGLHGLYPAMAEQSVLSHEHAVGKEQHLTGCLIIVLGIARQPSHIGHGGNTHEHVVQPHRVLLRAQTCKDAVSEPVLLIDNIVGIQVDTLSQRQRRVVEHGLDHRHAHGTGIVQRMGVDDATHVDVDVLMLLIDFLEIGRHVAQQFVALVDVVAIGIVAGGLISCQHRGIGDAPLIAGQSETALLQLGVLVDILQAGHLPARTFVYQLCRGLTLYIAQHTVDGLLDTLLGGNAVALLVGRPHQVQRCVVVVHLLAAGSQRGQQGHHGYQFSHSLLFQKWCYGLVGSQIETWF